MCSPVYSSRHNWSGETMEKRSRKERKNLWKHVLDPKVKSDRNGPFIYN